MRSLVLSLCVLGLAAPALAAVAVVPNANATTLGNGQSTNPLLNYSTTGGRYQQVYDASQFATFGASETVTGISFRAKQAPFLTFIGNTVNVSNIIITLSTTQKNDNGGLDATLANNVGPDVTTVYSGPLTLTSANGGTTAIDYNITLQNLFTYTKAGGNLLLDILIPAGASVTGNGSIGFEQFDTVTDSSFPSTDGTSSAFGGPNAAVGSNSVTGDVTQFTTIAAVGAAPEPASLSLLAIGFAGLLLRKRPTW